MVKAGIARSSRCCPGFSPNGTKPPADEPELLGEHHHGESAEHEHRHGEEEAGGGRDHPVGQASAPDGGEGAERDAETSRDQPGRADQLQRAGEAQRDLVDDRRAVAKRRAEVASDEAEHGIRVAGEDRLIETELAPEVGDGLRVRRGALLGEEKFRGIARDEVDGEEDEGGDRPDQEE
jgi:hypothetical protein